MSVSFSNHVAPLPDVMFRLVGDESVLLNLKRGEYSGLDAVGTRMWTVLTESDSIQNAFQTLLTEYDVEATQLRQDLEELLKKLVENELILILPGNAAPRTES
jgi:hypothetical protein